MSEEIYKLMPDLIRGAGLLVAALLAVSACAGAARAQAPKQTAPAEPTAPPNAAQAPPGWAVRCDNGGKGLVCKAAQTIVLAKTRQLLLSVAVSKPAGGQNAALLLHLPHGLFNPAGVVVSIDSATPQALQIQTCDARGCYAGMPISPENLGAMRTGTKLNVVFEDLKRQKITVPVPLKGFAAAFSKL
jgi:invasion protein IalB